MTMLLGLPGSAEAPRRKWTRQEYHKLIDTGFIVEGDHYELVEGEILETMVQKRPHLQTCMRVQHLLDDVYGRERVQSQGPVAVDDFNETEPDVAVLRRSTDDYADHPGPEDVVLLVEVSLTTLRIDTTVKAVVYSRAGIPEYWILNLADRILLVLRDPTPDGYTTQTTLTEADTVSPLSAPQASLVVEQMLPPVSLA